MVDATRTSRIRGTMGDWSARYRDRWKWDKVTWGTHSVDCYPGGCPMYVFQQDGQVLREEQAGVFRPIEKGIPDMNPMGCQKGCMWSHTLTGPDRVTHPLKRAGERGEGKWQRVSWDEALTEIADAMLDAIEEQGPESILNLGTPEPGAGPARLFAAALGSPSTDGNAEFQDFSPGFYLTWGVFNPVSSMDDWFLAELTLIWHANPVYTNIHWYHFINESRYNGGEVVTIAPDYSPSAIHADWHLPVKIGTDVALGLAMCKVIIDAGLYNKKFVQEQTDLSLLVRKDTKRFLVGSEVIEGEREDQFYWADERSGDIVPAPRGTLAMGNVIPALEGTYFAHLRNGRTVEVTTVFELLKKRLERYTPEKAARICGVHPDAIRKLARKVATRRTKIFCGWNSGKYYHGDLIERTMALLLALTGNWGKKGTGTRSWAVSGFAAAGAAGRRSREANVPRLPDTADQIQRARQLLMRQDPTLTLEMIGYRLAELQEGRGGVQGRTIPPAFLWHHHYGYRENWNRKDFHDKSMKGSWDEYFEEAVEAGWWDRGLARAWEKVTPRVLVECGGNMLRRDRGGQRLLLEHLWPKLKMIVSVDYRITTTGLHSDFILPAAQHYEKMTTSMPSVHHLNTVLGDKAVDPPDDAKTDWEIGALLVAKLEQRAKDREMTEYSNFSGDVRSFEGMLERVRPGGLERTQEDSMASSILAGAAAGLLPKDTTLARLRETGYVRWTGWPIGGHGLAQASTIEPNSTFNPFRWHTEDKLPYPTLTRRAQFYIDHDWFMEADEQLPKHKETPRQGGNYPFRLTSGHNRWSVHSMHMTNNIIMNTHRGTPFVFMNDKDAAKRGIENGEEVRFFNDVGYFLSPVKLSPAVSRGQVILYNGFEPYMHREWWGEADIEPGMIKWLGLAGGYGHLRYRGGHWQPIPSDRAVHLDIEKLG
jgi:DMSO reductase family type II enzyme molybdopterin subunit